MKLLLLNLILLVAFTSFSQNVKKSYDKFSGQTTFTTPIFGKGLAATTPVPIVARKYISQDSTVSYSINFTAMGYTPTVNGTGITVLFTDGTKLEFPEKISVSVNSGGNYEYNGFIMIKESELNVFSEKSVEGFKLYIYEGAFLFKSHAEKFRLNVSELIKSK
jgi:hypothetical protein